MANYVYRVHTVYMYIYIRTHYVTFTLSSLGQLIFAFTYFKLNFINTTDFVDYSEKEWSL